MCNLLRHGLLKPSYIPDRNLRELRELVRYHCSLIQRRSHEHNRTKKCRKEPATVVSDIMGGAAVT
ncbi:hypothetical protein [Paenibacillus polymyxa]|uniref:hypothetical protein n=1 Tax=Paenibacillus polymyxa TaxID=1406 RepID=UPI0039FC5A2C